MSGNAVTFLAAAVLYVLAVGQVKGFAFTLGLTTILDVVVVFLVTWPLVYLASKSTTAGQAGVQRARRRAADRARTTSGGACDGTGIVRWPNAHLDATESGAVEAPDLETRRPTRRKHGFFVRLYTGTGAFEVIGQAQAVVLDQRR